MDDERYLLTKTVPLMVGGPDLLLLNVMIEVLRQHSDPETVESTTGIPAEVVGELLDRLVGRLSNAAADIRGLPRPYPPDGSGEGDMDALAAMTRDNERRGM